MFYHLGTAKLVTTLEITQGYRQVPVAVENCAKTAFITPLWLYQLRVTPFALKGGPEAFQYTSELHKINREFRNVHKSEESGVNSLL